MAINIMTTQLQHGLGLLLYCWEIVKLKDYIQTGLRIEYININFRRTKVKMIVSSLTLDLSPTLACMVCQYLINCSKNISEKSYNSADHILHCTTDEVLQIATTKEMYEVGWNEVILNGNYVELW